MTPGTPSRHKAVEDGWMINQACSYHSFYSITDYLLLLIIQDIKMTLKCISSQKLDSFFTAKCADVWGEGGTYLSMSFQKKGSILEATLTMWKACFTKEGTQVE